MRSSKLKAQSSREAPAFKLQRGSGRPSTFGVRPAIKPLRFLGLFLCALRFALGASAADAVLPPCCRALAPSAPLTDKSLYQLDSRWTSDHDKQIQLRVLHGRPQVLTLFFTHCEFACPIIIHDLQRLAAALPANLRGQVDFLLVSLDPERDTVPALRAFREQRKLPLANWTLLRGANDDVRELAALLGVNYQKDARGQFAHSNLITVLNAAGEIIHQQIGLNQDPAATLKALTKATAPVAPPAPVPAPGPPIPPRRDKS